MESNNPPLPRKEDIQPRTPYQSVPVNQVIVLTVATFGLYNLWWFYQQWRHQRDYTGEAMWPVWRALLAILFCFPLFSQIEKDAGERGIRLFLPAGLMSVLFVASVLTRKLPDPYWLLYFAHLGPLVIMQQAINRLIAHDHPAEVLSTRLGFGSGIVVTLGGLCWILVLIGLFTPEAIVRDGGDLQDQELAYLLDQGYVLPNERVVYFYSAGFWSIQEDGNIVTEDRVISYENADGFTYHAAAYFEEIYSIDVLYAEHWIDDTQVTITTSAGEEIFLLVSTEAGRDETFVNRIRSEWRKRVPEGEEKLEGPSPGAISERAEPGGSGPGYGSS